MDLFCIIIIGVQEYHITTKHHSTPSCLRHAFVVPSLWLPLESELMMDAEGHHQGGRAKTPNKERRGIEPFERIRMKGITSISVGGMVLHQRLHRVGQKGAEDNTMAFGGLSDGGKEGADDATHEMERHVTVRLERV